MKDISLGKISTEKNIHRKISRLLLFPLTAMKGIHIGELTFFGIESYWAYWCHETKNQIYLSLFVQKKSEPIIFCSSNIVDCTYQKVEFSPFSCVTVVTQN
jgi:hypothetical protein